MAKINTGGWKVVWNTTGVIWSVVEMCHNCAERFSKRANRCGRKDDNKENANQLPGHFSVC